MRWPSSPEYSNLLMQNAAWQELWPMPTTFQTKVRSKRVLVIDDESVVCEAIAELSQFQRLPRHTLRGSNYLERSQTAAE